jgi:hypothetical protein
MGEGLAVFRINYKGVGGMILFFLIVWFITGKLWKAAIISFIVWTMLEEVKRK